MQYLLNDSVMCKYLESGELIVSVTDMEPMCVSAGQDELLEVLALFSKPRTFDQAFELLNQKFYMSWVYFEECFEMLRIRNLLKEYHDTVSDISSYHMEKYKRQISSFHALLGVEKTDAVKMQKDICNSTVCIVGVGGTGSHLALSLASIGVENLILVDFDNIELSNTSRQVLYTENDVGKNKIAVAKEKLLQYNSKANITTYNIHIKSDEDMSFLENHKVDLLILCADTPRGEIQYIVDRAAQKNEVPWFGYGPYHHSQIMVGPYIIPGKTRSFAELFKQQGTTSDERTDLLNAGFVASICDPYNGFASQFAAIEVLKILSGYKKTALINRRYYIDTDEWKIDYVEYDTRM